jgi:hypothetical protein
LFLFLLFFPMTANLLACSMILFLIILLLLVSLLSQNIIALYFHLKLASYNYLQICLVQEILQFSFRISHFYFVTWQEKCVQIFISWYLSQFLLHPFTSFSVFHKFWNKVGESCHPWCTSFWFSPSVTFDFLYYLAIFYFLFK